MSDNVKMIDSEELDRLFDEGEVDILQYFDTDNVRYPGREACTVVVVLPRYVLEAVEREADKADVTLQDLIESWIEEKVKIPA